MLQGRIAHQTIKWSEVPSLDKGAFLSRLNSLSDRRGLPLLGQSISLDDWEDSRYLDREQMVQTLVAVNNHYDNTLSDEVITGLREDALMVVTGQQPGLMMGPMFSIYKAWTAIKKAEELSLKTGRRVYPAFWIATEDHDLEEVNRFTLAQGKRFVCNHSELQGPRPAVGRISLEPFREELLGFLREHLADEDCFEELYQGVELMDFSDYGSFFASWLLKVLGRGNVILMDPMRMRNLTAPVLADLVKRWPGLLQSLDKGASPLEQEGITAPLESLTLFNFKEGVRKAENYDNSTQTFANRVTPDQLSEEILAFPELYSPSAGLRPITQDAAFPVLAYVGGPGELKYLWQIDPLYTEMKLKRSQLIPRISASMIDFATRRRSQKLQMDDHDLFRVKQWLEHQASYLDLDQIKYEQIRTEAHRLLSMIMKERQGIEDQKIDRSLESIDYQVSKAIRRIEEKRQQAVGGGRPALERISAVLFPDGGVQERTMGPAMWVARYGWDHLSKLVESLDVDGQVHQLVTIDHRD